MSVFKCNDLLKVSYHVDDRVAKYIVTVRW